MAADPNVWRRSVSQAISGQMTVAAHRMIGQGLRDVNELLPSILQDLSKAMDLSLIPRSYLKAANLEIALEAQAAIVAGWKKRLPRNSGPYRSHSRLVGALGRALAEENMTAGTTDRRISFINQAALGNEARHWYRVNYGAAGPNLSEGHQAEPFTGTVNGQPLFTLRDTTPPASQSWLPRGFHWRGGNFPGGMFFPDKDSAPTDVRGHGIRAAHFTDLGVRVVARRTGEVYVATMRNYAKTAAGQLKFATHNIKVEGDVGRFGQI